MNNLLDNYDLYVILPISFVLLNFLKSKTAINRLGLVMHFYQLYDNYVRIIQSLSLTLFIFGLLGWLYIAGNAWFHPETLSLGLTHFAPWPREDTFGAVSFAVSFISFFIWNFTKEKSK